MTSYTKYIAVARDGKEFVQIPGESTQAVDERCKAYENELAQAAYDALAGHVQLYIDKKTVDSCFVSRKTNDVFIDYHDLYIRIYDFEGVALANTYVNLMRKLIDRSTGDTNQNHPLEIFTNDDVGRTIRMYYNEGYNAWERYDETLEDMIERNLNVKRIIDYTTSVDECKNMICVSVEGMEE